MNERPEPEEPGTEQPLDARLRAAAAAHQPDRARMLARIARAVEEPGTSRQPRRGPRRGLRPPAHRPRPGTRAWPRVAAAAGALVVVLALGGTTALWARHADRPTAGDGRPPTVRTSTQPAPSAGPPRTGRPPAVAGPLRSSGALDPGGNDYWSQTEVTVRTEKPLSALTVELRLAERTPLTSTGSWRTRPPGDFEEDVRHENGSLVYRWTLKKGRSVPPGRHVFAGQYDHGSGKRSSADDEYTVSATAGGRGYTVGGGITAG
ncbi:hypothetical protein ACIGW3_05875 [Streptomyces sp. NPDC053499]|uniref:hypothetical protein n=1 Tax=Streptomyces sp. NPDC053499 TaxID=3365707 RepID=UPI0037CFA0AA